MIEIVDEWRERIADRDGPVAVFYRIRTEEGLEAFRRSDLKGTFDKPPRERRESYLTDRGRGPDAM